MVNGNIYTTSYNNTKQPQYYPPQQPYYPSQQPYPPQKGDTWKYIIVGGVLIAIAGAGIYYLYNRTKVVDEAIELIKDYELEYNEFMVDGVISEEEGNLLEQKRLTLQALINKINEKGLMGQFIDTLWTLGIVIPIVTATYIIFKLIERYLKRHPPPQAPPGKPWKDPMDNTYWPTPEDLVNHAHDEYPDTPPADAPAMHDIWEDIKNLPSWFLAMVGACSDLAGVGWEDAIGKWWEDLSPERKAILCFGLIAALILATALTLGWLAPETAPIIAALAAAA